MRFKYYLRGAGLGILLATLVLTIAFAVHGRKISNEEVIRRAQALGMVMPEKEDDGPDITTENDFEDSESMEDASSEMNSTEILPPENETTESGDMTPEQQAIQELLALDASEYFVLEIERGDTARIIGEKLQEAQVVTDAEAFRKYLGHSGKDQEIKTGTYIIPYGVSFSRMIEILGYGPIDPELLNESL